MHFEWLTHSTSIRIGTLLSLCSIAGAYIHNMVRSFQAKIADTTNRPHSSHDGGRRHWDLSDAWPSVRSFGCWGRMTTISRSEDTLVSHFRLTLGTPGETVPSLPNPLHMAFARAMGFCRVCMKQGKQPVSSYNLQHQHQE